MTLGDDVSIEEIEREHIARLVARAASFEAAARILGIGGIIDGSPGTVAFPYLS